MDPLTVLKGEHASILQQLYSIDRKLGWLESSGPEKAAKILSSLRGVSDRMWKDLSHHFYREETALYPLLEKRLGYDAEPVRVMRQEHQNLLEGLMSVRSEVSRMFQEQDLTKTWGLVDKLQTLRATLTDHVSKEEQVLFWLAELNLTDLDKRKISFDLLQAIRLPELSPKVGLVSKAK